MQARNAWGWLNAISGSLAINSKLRVSSANANSLPACLPAAITRELYPWRCRIGRICRRGPNMSDHSSSNPIANKGPKKGSSYLPGLELDEQIVPPKHVTAASCGGLYMLGKGLLFKVL